MWNELIVLIIITILYIFLSRTSERLMLKMKPETDRIKEIKLDKYKTIEQQKEFVTLQSDTGGDLISIVYGWVIFLIPFVFLIQPKLDNIYSMLVVVPILSLILAYVAARIIFPHYIEEATVKHFVNYLYVGFFLSYINLVDLPNIWYCLGIVSVLLIGLPWILNKYVSKH